MIERFRDHAANERTFLAWVRTAIALMAFGFLVEKFDLFIAFMAPQSAQRSLVSGSQGVGHWVGLFLIVLGVAMTGIAIIRFLHAARAINSPELLRGFGYGLDLTIAVLLILLGIAMALYLSRFVG